MARPLEHFSQPPHLLPFLATIASPGCFECVPANGVPFCLAGAIPKGPAPTPGNSEQKPEEQSKSGNNNSHNSRNFEWFHEALRLAPCLESQNHAVDIKLRAERQAGDLLGQLERGSGNRHTARASNAGRSSYATTLDEAGLTSQAANHLRLVDDEADGVY